jgi:hypothetical protein
MATATAAVIPRQDDPYAGYLLSTFSDADPRVFWYLSTAESPLAFTPLNGGEPVLGSTVGTQAVRDIFLTSNDVRSEYFVIATGISLRLSDHNENAARVWLTKAQLRPRYQRRGIFLGRSNPPWKSRAHDLEV